jgi:surfeit locus 1 family protein
VGGRASEVRAAAAGPPPALGTLTDTMLRTLVSPRLLLSHLLVLVVVVGCLAASLWQWDRLGQARENNERLEARLQADPVDVAALDGLRSGELEPEELEFRRAEATGTFRPGEEVLQRNQSHRQTQGLHVLTPLELTDGGVVLVRRGWVPSDLDDPPVVQAPPPAGEVRVEGVLELSVDQPGIGARDPDDGVLERVFHSDAQRLDRQIDGELLPMVLRLEEVTGETGELPLVLDAPTIDEGSHLSYTLQWLSFALIALITYGLWLRKRLRRDTASPDPPGGAVTPPPAPTVHGRASSP